MHSQGEVVKSNFSHLNHFVDHGGVLVRFTGHNMRLGRQRGILGRLRRENAECDYSFEVIRCRPHSRSQSVHVGAQISNSMSLRGLHSGRNRWTRRTSDTPAPEIPSRRQLPRRPASPWPASPVPSLVLPVTAVTREKTVRAEIRHFLATFIPRALQNVTCVNRKKLRDAEFPPSDALMVIPPKAFVIHNLACNNEERRLVEGWG